MAELVMDAREQTGFVQLVLSGEFDLAGILAFDERIRKLEATEPAVIVIDLTAVDFMDSSGLRALVTAHDRAQKAGRRLAIVPGPPQVKRVFEITQLDERLDLVDDASGVVAG